MQVFHPLLRIYNYTKILIPDDEIGNFFDIFESILLHHCTKYTPNLLYQHFMKFHKEFQTETLKEDVCDYIPPRAFLSDTLIKSEEGAKKKTWQYTKYKTIPKWHHYALDIIKCVFTNLVK